MAKRRADKPLPDSIGDHLTNRLGSMKKRTARKFSRALLKLQSQRFPRLLASRSLTQRTFAQAYVVHIHDIGWRWRNSSEFRRLSEAVGQARQHLFLLNGHCRYNEDSMGIFYFDESIHPRGEFTLGVFVYSEESLDQPVAEALLKSGLRPRVDEFKSRARMDQSACQKQARALLHTVVHDHCRVGVLVTPSRPRNLLGGEALRGLNKILSTNTFRTTPHDVFFDEGIFSGTGAGKRAADAHCVCQSCSFHFEQNSREVLGLQVADLIAHTCSTMLLAQLGLVNKKVKAGHNSGYDPNLDMELEFELWATVRWNFFATAPPDPYTWKSQLDFQIDVASRGLHVAESCDERVRSAALARFGSMYVGCIH